MNANLKAEGSALLNENIRLKNDYTSIRNKIDEVDKMLRESQTRVQERDLAISKLKEYNIFLIKKLSSSVPFDFVVYATGKTPKIVQMMFDEWTNSTLRDGGF
ncbi:MAG TPA: hypothetical protein VL443_30085 [Cyclobacteriaceae bacterium]|jgi:hypothetical protein|nr:hypothetical protein [Cyclobacteriaceae bacterium]